MGHSNPATLRMRYHRKCGRKRSGIGGVDVNEDDGGGGIVDRGLWMSSIKS